jgi:hypothetical protein
MEVRLSGRIRSVNPWTDRQEEVRRRLRNYRALVAKHAACRALYDQLFPRTTARLSDEPHGGQVEMFELESVVSQRIDLSMQMARAMHDMQVEISAIIDMIKGLPADEYTILMRRYLMSQTWEEISRELRYCVEQAIRIHNRAIVRLGEKMPNNVN